MFTRENRQILAVCLGGLGFILGTLGHVFIKVYFNAWHQYLYGCCVAFYPDPVWIYAFCFCMALGLGCIMGAMRIYPWGQKED